MAAVGGAAKGVVTHKQDAAVVKAGVFDKVTKAVKAGMAAAPKPGPGAALIAALGESLEPRGTAADLIAALSEPLEPKVVAPPAAPLTPAQARLKQKVADFQLNSPQAAFINWQRGRVYSPEGLCAYKGPGGTRYISFDEGSDLQLFRSGVNSQGLFMHDGRVVAASVTADITTATARKSEKKGTAVQYDKHRVVKGDFAFDATNYRGCVNYQGGHLIDHKYSAGGSHYHEPNYIPMHYFYNAPLKEYLVQHGDAYVEIPLYTPNPPKIGVMGQKDKFHAIPVGIIFIQLLKNKVKDVFFFPNNNFDYKGLKDKLGLTSKLAENIAPYFRLHASFHPLLRAAMINDLAQEAAKAKQEKREARFLGAADEISEGMMWAEHDEEADLVSRVSFQVLHEKDVNPYLCLDCDGGLEGQPLAPAFNALGQFLVRHCLKNALKSEVISIWSRLIFVNVVVDFIDGYTQVQKKALEFIDSLAKEFWETLHELSGIIPNMTRRELFYLANIYQRLSNQFNHAFSFQGYAIFDDDDFEGCFRKFIVIIQYIAEIYPIKNLEGDEAWSFLAFVQEAQQTLNYYSEAGFPKEHFEREGALLRSLRGDCVALLDKLQGKNPGVSVQFQTNIKHAMSTRTSTNYVRSVLENLGFSDSDASEGENESNAGSDVEEGKKASASASAAASGSDVDEAEDKSAAASAAASGSDGDEGEDESDAASRNSSES